MFNIKKFGVPSSKFPFAEIELSYKPLFNALDRPVIENPNDAYKLLAPSWEAMELRESFKLICLNASQNVLGVWTAAIGRSNAAPLDIRLCMATALLTNAESVMIAHNHPSGDHSPSQEDYEVTRRFNAACETLGILLLDHLIFSRNGYYSFGNNGFFK